LAEDWEQGLAAAVVQYELVGGGGTVPALADGAAAKNVLRRQTKEDLFDDDRLRKVVQDGCASAAWHGDRLAAGALSDPIPRNYKNYVT
jgi:hypothetical protein